MSIITLLTDFGTADGYVAAMKGVIRTITPDVILDDAAHDIDAGDSHAAAWCLGAYWDRYPAGTVHLVVVDPGVGSARRGLAAELAGRRFVCPDNGILTYVLRAGGAGGARFVHIDEAMLAGDGASATFHGRDIFAPAAARLARGDSIDELGSPAHDPVLLALPQPVREGGGIRGEVVHVDRYGNLITNVPASWLGADVRVTIGGRDVPFVRTYSDAPRGAPLALVGSRGVLEISIRDGSAHAGLGLARAAAVRIIG